MKIIARWLVVLALLLTAPAYAQSTLLQAGPITPGHAPMYVNSGSSQAVVQDSGPAGGGPVGLGMGEGLYVARGTGTPPYAGQGTGPFGTNWCDYDAPITNATGYHSLCLSANASGGGLLAYEAGGTASPLPLNFNINGASYQFPAILSGIGGPVSSVINNVVCWNNTIGTLVKDCGISLGSQSGNLVLATPSGSSGVPSFRALTVADIPTSSAFTWTGAHTFSSDLVTLTGTSSGVFPNYQTVSSLELVNTNTSTQGVGARIYFSQAAGTPYAEIGSYLVSGPSPGVGYLGFAISQNINSPPVLAGVLDTSGELYFGALANKAQAGGANNFAAVNSASQHAFIGFTDTSVASSNSITDAGYFVDRNNNVSHQTIGTEGVYAEASTENGGNAYGIEADAENDSGFEPTIPDVNTASLGGSVSTFPYWSAITGTRGPPFDPGDVSGIFGVPSLPGLGDTGAYLSGFSIARAAIKADGSGHIVFFAVTDGSEMTWKDVGGDVGRLTSNGLVLKWNGNAGVTCSGSPTSSFASVGGLVTHC